MWVRWRSRWPIGWREPLLGLLLLLLALPTLRLSPSTGRPRPVNVAPGMWERAADGVEVDFLVVLHEQADLGTTQGLDRRQRVVQRLRETALRTQMGLRALLDRRGVPYRPYYVVNALAVRGDRRLVAELAARPEVARIVGDPWVKVPLPPVGAGGPRIPSTVEWNVHQVNADDVWALGYVGEGVVVAGQDTGYDWDHPALIAAYRGWDGITATHDYNWHDAIHVNEHGANACGVDSPEPCDDYGHGTHTMGTMVGQGGIGVAPGARWIGCRNMDNGWGKPSTYIECFEFFLAPYPVGGTFLQGDPERAPHVINNSWYCPPEEGCDWWTLQAVVGVVRAAGILVVASAGNDGPACSTVRNPPAVYEAAFTVGATDAYDHIANFSSRGPVTVDGSNRRKPDIAAPGVSVRSSIPGGGYTLMSGTSMAGPHVAGAAALLWSAAPSLIGDVGETERALERSARPRISPQNCGEEEAEEVPNNVYGWGIVDALAAIAGVEAGQRAIPHRARPSAVLTYTLYVTNTGYVTLTATITDRLPAHVFPTGVLTWTTSLPPGGIWTETVRVTTEVGYLGPLTNTLEVETAEGTTDVDLLTTPVVPFRLFLPAVMRQR